LVKIKTILSIDGGGIRGIVPLTILSEMGMNAKDFDYIVGTSIGGIIAAGLSFYSARQMSYLLEESAEDIFSKRTFSSLWGLSKSKYGNKYLRRFLENTFNDNTMKDLITNTLIVSYDVTKNKPKIFKSSQDKTSLVDACLATSAAPTYFPPHKVSDSLFVDGGVFMNNPVLVAIAESLYENPDEKILLLSLGCGDEGKTYKIKNGGLLNWANDIIDLFMEGNTNGLDFFLKYFFDRKRLQYLRIQPKLKKEIALDDCDKIEDLKNLAKEEYLLNKNQYDRFSKLIKQCKE